MGNVQDIVETNGVTEASRDHQATLLYHRIDCVNHPLPCHFIFHLLIIRLCQISHSLISVIYSPLTPMPAGNDSWTARAANARPARMTS